MEALKQSLSRTLASLLDLQRSLVNVAKYTGLMAMLWENLEPSRLRQQKRTAEDVIFSKKTTTMYKGISWGRFMSPFIKRNQVTWELGMGLHTCTRVFKVIFGFLKKWSGFLISCCIPPLSFYVGVKEKKD